MKLTGAQILWEALVREGVLVDYDAVKISSGDKLSATESL